MSDFFEWDQGKYGLNIPRMDEEHQQIITAMNELHVAYAAQAPRARLSEALERLQRVTLSHFKDEERFMESIGYEELRKHRLMHHHLLERLEGFAREFKASGQLSDALFLFLKMWLKSHICGIDTQYASRTQAA